MKVLVVGGAGYIGSHCVRQLVYAGHQPVVLDSLCYGHRAAVGQDIPFYQVDLGNKEEVTRILKLENIDIVMHFAAFINVGESVTEPLKYYENNVSKTVALLQAMDDAGVRKFVFSSTCATFGTPESLPIHENLPQAPINPYGQTKLDVEHMLKSLCYAKGFSCAVFRYFNAAGAAEDGMIGEDHSPETHLIPLCFDAATGRRGALKVFGTDYPTPDGTCLRDYIHVDDLSRAHIMVFDKLSTAGGFFHYNLGTGSPSSVREVIDTVARVTGLEVPYEEAERREGDPASLYADNRKVVSELGWEPRICSLEAIIASAWKWHFTHPNGY